MHETKLKTIVFRMLLIGCTAAVGCVSPETTRTRGDGRGADVGNRPQVVKMHDGSEPYWKTPRRIATNHPPLESSRQAEQLSRQ